MRFFSSQKSKRYATFFAAAGLIVSWLGSVGYKKLHSEPYPSLCMPYFVSDKNIDYPLFPAKILVVTIMTKSGESTIINLRDFYTDMSPGTRQAVLIRLFSPTAVNEKLVMPTFSSTMKEDILSRLRRGGHEMENIKNIKLGWVEAIYNIEEPDVIVRSAVISEAEFWGTF